MVKNKAKNDGEQMQLEGMEEKLSTKLKNRLRADRDATNAENEAKKGAKSRRQALLDQMVEEGINRVRCPYRDKIVIVDATHKIKFETVKEPAKLDGDKSAFDK